MWLAEQKVGEEIKRTINHAPTDLLIEATQLLM
jgi:hypothetical protein